MYNPTAHTLLCINQQSPVLTYDRKLTVPDTNTRACILIMRKGSCRVATLGMATYSWAPPTTKREAPGVERKPMRRLLNRYYDFFYQYLEGASPRKHLGYAYCLYL